MWRICNAMSILGEMWDNLMNHNLVYLAGLIVIVIILRMVTSSTSSKKKSKSASRKRNIRPTVNNRTSSAKRPDSEILKQPLDALTWAEFERLLALYFRDHGYEVEEPGIGGNDGGVDLVIIARSTGERTAVQAKHWTDRRHVGPNIIRELHSSRLNTTPTCHYGMLITSSDISPKAREEAQARHIEYWHGSVLEHKLEKWDKWQGKNKRSRSRSGVGAK